MKTVAGSWICSKSNAKLVEFGSDCPGKRFVGGETFGIQRLVSKIELFLQGLDQTSS